MTDDSSKLDILEQRVATLEEVVASIGQKELSPLDEDLPEQDQLLPTTAVAKRYGVSPRCIARWVGDPDLNFPKPELIRLRKYWRESVLRDWDRARLMQSIESR
jgi:hypothetical protein